MTIHRFTPPGRITDTEIDALLDQYATDDWLAAALIIPLIIGIFACILMIVTLSLSAFWPHFVQIILTLTAVWPILLGITVVGMIYLGRRHGEECSLPVASKQ